MREILFRGKRKDNGEWVDGNFYESKMSGCFILQAKIKARTNRRTGYTIFGDEAIPFEVEPLTVGQYTGLTDKNGKRIFEGDICNIVIPRIDGDFDRHEKCECKYEDGCFWFIADDGDWWRGNEYGYPDTAHMNIEIIGNIHDNPELLDGEET